MAVFQSLGTPQPQQSQPQNVEPSRAKKVLRYTMMPEILPRIRGLGIHFGHFAYLLALVFASARLIPQAHPVMNAANIGRFGVRQVIAIAANNLTWTMKNIDQIAIFSAIVMGLIMIVIQLGLIAVMVFTGGEAQASGVNANDPGSFFVSPNPSEDPVMWFLAQVFGDLDGFWGASFVESDKVFGTETAIHRGVYSILSLYSMATMVIAVIIVLYYILTVVGEAAKTGTPFGQRFNSLWAPIRLVVALGLLVPLGSGLNSAQYITLWLAKQGSGLGTQAWNLMADNLTTLNAESYVFGDFRNDWVREAALNIFLMEVCMEAENKYNSGSGALIRKNVVEDNDTTHTYKVIYEGGETYSDGEWHRRCGVVSVNLKEQDTDSAILKADSIPIDQVYEKSKDILNAMLGLGSSSAAAGDNAIQRIAKQVANKEISVGGAGGSVDDPLQAIIDYADNLKNGALGQEVSDEYRQGFNETMQALVDKRKNSWAYSGVWYLEISRLIQATKEIKNNVRPNLVLGDVGNASYEITDLRETRVLEEGDTFRLRFLRVSAETQAAVQNAFRYINKNKNKYVRDDEKPAECKDVEVDSSGWSRAACAVAAMIIPDELTMLADPNNKTLDPMATLINAGYSIFEKSWTFIGYGFLGSTFGGIASAFGGGFAFLGGILSTLGSVLVLIGALGITAGFVLYFLLPVLPFLYFFFAVVSWIMEIFEAIIAMPLWALAHLRIDGDGMPGQAAINGYYLLLAILIRPALIVVGLIAGALVFGGAVFLLQELFQGVLVVKGSGSSSGLESLIYTLIFAYTAYSAGVTSFKLVDGIPNQILRWIGSGANTFSDGKEDPIGGNQQLMAAAGGFIGSSAANSISQGASGLGQSAGKGLNDRYGSTGQRATDAMQARMRAEDQFNSAKQTDDILEASGSERKNRTRADDTVETYTQREAGGEGFQGEYNPNSDTDHTGPSIDGDDKK